MCFHLVSSYTKCVELTQVDCFDYDSDGDHDLIGGFTTTVSEMMQAAAKPVRLHFLSYCHCHFHRGWPS